MMQTIDFAPGSGAVLLLVFLGFFSAIPALALYRWLRTFRSETVAGLAGAMVFSLFFGAFHQLIVDRFDRLRMSETGRLSLHYILPERTVELPRAEVADISAIPERDGYILVVREKGGARHESTRCLEECITKMHRLLNRGNGSAAD